MGTALTPLKPQSVAFPAEEGNEGAFYQFPTHFLSNFLLKFGFIFLNKPSVKEGNYFLIYETRSSRH